MDNHNLPVEDIIHRTDSRPFSIHYTEVDTDEASALYLHCHPEAELFYLISGEIIFTIENRSFCLKSGEGIFIPPNLIHSAIKSGSPKAPCCFHAIVFSREMLEMQLPPYCHSYFAPLDVNIMECICPICKSIEECRTLLALLPRLFEAYRKEMSSYELRLTGLLLECWQELYNICFSRMTPASIHSGPTEELQKSLDYIKTHFSDSLTLPELAQKSGLSESYFSHSFRNLTGFSPIAYVNRLRIIKSCEYLTKTNKKITEIASLCGYNNISYFNRIFYKMMERTPSEYRKGDL